MSCTIDVQNKTFAPVLIASSFAVSGPIWQSTGFLNGFDDSRHQIERLDAGNENHVGAGFPRRPGSVRSFLARFS